MARITKLATILISVCLLSSGLGADNQPKKKVANLVAVMDLNCGAALAKEECTALTNIVIEELVKLKKFTVIDRANRDKLLSEMGFQQSACADENCTVEAGRLLGVGKMVVGAATKLGETYLVGLQLIDVETGVVEISASERCRCEPDGLIDAVINVAHKLVGETPAIATPPSEDQPRPSPFKGGRMVEVPAGEFVMGGDSGDPDERPSHRVYLDKFYIDKFEVKNEQYQQCVLAGQCSENKRYRGFTDPEQPVVGVDWNQAASYCAWVGKKLPTEAEWEKAARGDDGQTYPWGEGINCERANFAECKYGKTKPVGSYPEGASAYGAMDMAGNASEWTADWYGKKYYKTSPKNNPRGPFEGKYRVRRGGSWADNSRLLRSSKRDSYDPSYPQNFSGFRCVAAP